MSQMDLTGSFSSHLVSLIALKGVKHSAYAYKSGTINLSYMIYIDTSYLIIRGAGNDPNAGGTKILFRPDGDTKYDKITNDRVGGKLYAVDLV